MVKLLSKAYFVNCIFDSLNYTELEYISLSFNLMKKEYKEHIFNSCKLASTYTLDIHICILSIAIIVQEQEERYGKL